MREPTCYLSFPDDALSAANADRLRTHLQGHGITVLPPPDDGSLSMSSSSFYWLRLADVVVLDLTDDSSWVIYEAGAATALNKRLIPIARSGAAPSRIGRQLPRALDYEPDQIARLAEYVNREVLRNLPTSS